MMTTLTVMMMTITTLGLGYGHKSITVEPWDRSLLPPGTRHHPVYHQHHHPVKQNHHRHPGICVENEITNMQLI